MVRSSITGIVLQARMGSSRLPGKVMMELCGRPMLGHILDRLKMVANANLIIVATSTNIIDDIIESFSESQNVPCFRGSEMDVLDRYYQAARKFTLDHIVRATADNPLVDPEEACRLIELHLERSADYTHAFGQLPIGVGVECFTLFALERSWREGHQSNHREHVNEYIQEHPDRFHIEQLDIPQAKRASSLRLTVDTQNDFDRIAVLYSRLLRLEKYPTTEEGIKLCVTL
jgi:spore coat polysaccharide biosynthesis protein SpsF